MNLMNYWISLVGLSLLLAACASSPEVRTQNRSAQKPMVFKVGADPIKGSAVKPAAMTVSRDANTNFSHLRDLVRQSRWSEVLVQCDIILSNPTPLTDPQATEITISRIRALEGLGGFFDAAKMGDAALADNHMSTEHEWFRLKSSALIESRLNADELDKVIDDFSQNQLKAVASFRRAEMYLDERETSQASRFFSKAINLDPMSESANRARDRLAQVEAARRVEPRTIGVVLPLTGKHTSVAQKTLRGIQMGLGLYGNNVSNFRLAVVDSEASAEKARRGIETLIKEDNVIAVIGGLLSKTASAEAVKASELGVPSISLSQKSGLTDSSPLVFRNSLTAEMLVRELVRSAMEDRHIRRFGILYPNESYGVEFANLFWDEVLARGGEVTAVQAYSPRETDFRLPVQRLVGTYYVEDRSEEFQVRYKALKKNAPKKQRGEDSSDILPPVVQFEALFIPDSIKALGQISAMLAFNGVRGVKLVGTNLWNNPGLPKRMANNMNPVEFADGWLNTDPAFTNSAFVKEYRDLYGEDPSLFEVQGYDSAVLLRQLIAQGATSRESLTRALAKAQLGQGALSPLTMTEDREVLRPLVMLSLENGQIAPLNKDAQP